MPAWKKDNFQMVGNNILNGKQVVGEDNGILSEKKSIPTEHRAAWGKDSGIEAKVIETDRELFKRNEQEKEKEKDQVRVPGWSNQEKAKTKKKRSRKKKEERKREDVTYSNNIDPDIDGKDEELKSGNGDTITTNGVEEENETRKNTNCRHVKKVTQVGQKREQCEKRQARGEGNVKWDEEEEEEEEEEREEAEELEEADEPEELEEAEEAEEPEEPERDEQEERGSKDEEENKEKCEVTNEEGDRERKKEKYIKEFVEGSVGEVGDRSYKEVVHMSWEDRLNEYEEEADEFGDKNVETVETEEMLQQKRENPNNETNVNATGEKETKKKKKKKKRGKNGTQQKRSNQGEKKEEADKNTATNNTQITCSNKNKNGSDEENKSIVNKFPKKKIMLLKRNEGKREKDVHEDKKKQEYTTTILNTAKDEKTLEQREEEYNKIRARIFSDFNGGVNINNNDHNNNSNSNNNNSMNNNHGYNNKKNNLKMEDPGNIYFNYLANSGAFPYMNNFCNMYANNPYNLVYSPGNMMMHPGINTAPDVPSYYFQEGNVSHFPNYLCNFQNQQNFVNATNFFPYANTNDSSNTHNGNSYSSSNNNNNNNNTTSVPTALCVEGYTNNFVNINGSNNMNMNANVFGNHSLSKNAPGGKRKIGKGGNNTNVINNAMMANSGIMNLTNNPNSIIDSTNVNSKILAKMNKSNKMNKINKAFCEPHNIMLGNQMYNNSFLMNNMYLNDVTQKNMNTNFFSPYSSSNTFQYPYKNNLSTMNQSNMFLPYNRDNFASLPMSNKMNKGGKENKNFYFNKNANTSGMNKKNVITASAELNKNLEYKETEKGYENAGKKCGTGAAPAIEGEKREDRKKMEFVEKRRNVAVKDNVEEDAQGEENEAENGKKNINKFREKHVGGKIESHQKEDVTQFDADKNDSAASDVPKKEEGEEVKEEKEEEKEEEEEEEEGKVEVEVEVEEEGGEEDEEEDEEEEKEEEEEGEELDQNIGEREHVNGKGAGNSKPAVTFTENRHAGNKYPNKNNKNTNINKGNNSSNVSNNNKSINSNNSSSKNNNSSNSVDLNNKGNDTFNKKAEYMKREAFKNPYVDNKMYKNTLVHMQPIPGTSPLPPPPLPPSGEEIKEQRKAFHMNKKGMGKPKRNMIGNSSANSDIYAYSKVVENASLSYLYSGIHGVPPMREVWNKHKKTHSNNINSSSNNMNTGSAHAIHHNNVINNNNAVRGEGNDLFSLATNVANSSAHESLSGENILKKKKNNKKKKKNPLKEMNHNMPYVMNTAGNSLLSFYLNNNERPYMYNPSAIPNSNPNISYNPNRTMNMHMNYSSSIYTSNTSSMGNYYNHSYYPQHLINDLDYCRDAALFEKRFDKGDDLPPSFKRYDVDFPSL